MITISLLLAGGGLGVLALKWSDVWEIAKRVFKKPDAVKESPTPALPATKNTAIGAKVDQNITYNFYIGLPPSPPPLPPPS